MNFRFSVEVLKTEGSADSRRFVSSAEVGQHWRLLDAIVAGTTEDNSPLPSHTEREFWRQQIDTYGRYLALRARTPVAELLAFPDPPRAVYHVWLVHMLQPLAFQRDCAAAFGRCIPHTNRVPK